VLRPDGHAGLLVVVQEREPRDDRQRGAGTRQHAEAPRRHAARVPDREQHGPEHEAAAEVGLAEHEQGRGRGDHERAEERRPAARLVRRRRARDGVRHRLAEAEPARAREHDRELGELARLDAGQSLDAVPAPRAVELGAEHGQQEQGDEDRGIRPPREAVEPAERDEEQPDRRERPDQRVDRLLGRVPLEQRVPDRRAVDRQNAERAARRGDEHEPTSRRARGARAAGVRGRRPWSFDELREDVGDHRPGDVGPVPAAVDAVGDGGERDSGARVRATARPRSPRTRRC
jgi:hypothetical protein